MKGLSKTLITMAAVAMSLLGTVEALAQDTASDEEARARSYFTNLELVNQDGEKIGRAHV